MIRHIYKTAFLSSLVLFAWDTPARSADLVVVANSSVKPICIKPADLREIFLGERSSLPDGSKVIPVLLRSGRIHEAFLTTYLGKSEGSLEAGWRRMVFTGRGLMPRTFDSEADLLDYVAKTPGALGYAGGTGGRPGVKILTVK